MLQRTKKSIAEDHLQKQSIGFFLLAFHGPHAGGWLPVHLFARTNEVLALIGKLDSTS